MAQDINRLSIDSTVVDVFNAFKDGIVSIGKQELPENLNYSTTWVLDGFIKLFADERKFKRYNARDNTWTDVLSLDGAPSWSSIRGKPTIPTVINSESSTSTTYAASPSLVRKIFESSKNLTVYSSTDAYPNYEGIGSYHTDPHRIIDKNNAIQFKIGESSTHIYWVQTGQITRRTGSNSNEHSVTLMNNHNGSVICGLGTGNGARGGNKTVSLSVDNQIGYSRTVSYSISGENWNTDRNINLAMINYLIVYKTKK